MPSRPRASRSDAPVPSVPAGYSGTPLPRKLGIRPGSRVALVDAPPDLLSILSPLPDDVVLHRGFTGRSPLDVILCFVTSRATLQKRLPRAIARLDVAGGLWIAWPKRASGVRSDLTEDTLREICLPTGLVDNKVCAIDHTWSGLRFVRRLKDRERGAP